VIIGLVDGSLCYDEACYVSGKREDKQWHFRGVERFIWATSMGRHCWSNNGFLFKGSILIFDTVVRSECSHVLCTRAPCRLQALKVLRKPDYISSCRTLKDIQIAFWTPFPVCA
jgi:hypothetical protein